MNVSATEFKNRLGQYLDTAERDPVFVEKSGRVKSVLISYDHYERLLAYEDSYWASKAKEAEGDGYLGSHTTEFLLKKMNQNA